MSGASLADRPIERTRQLQQMLCLWSGPTFVLLFGAGFWGFSGFLPVPAASLDAQAVAALYRGHATQIGIGQVLVLLAAGLQVPWAALISAQMRKIPGCATELVESQFFAGASDSVWFMLPALLFMITAFRPERDPQLTQTLNDMAWLLLVAPVSAAMVQAGALGLAILGDASARPVFPRWAGYYNLTAAVIYAPGALAPFFKTGPFAWGGLFAFWLPAAEFFGWFVVMFFLLRTAMKR
jgi:hypothetical protein